MSPVPPLVRSGLVALLTFTLASAAVLAAPFDRRASDEALNGAMPTDPSARIPLRIGIADSHGFMPGLTLELVGEQGMIAVTGEDGTAVLEVPETASAIEVQVTDDNGSYWTAIAYLTAQAPPDAALLLLDGNVASLYLAGPGDAELEAFASVFESLQADWLPAESSGNMFDLGGSLPGSGAPRRGAGRVEPSHSGLDAVLHRDRNELAGSDATGNDIRSRDAVHSTGSRSPFGTTSLPGSVPSMPPSVLAWGGESEPNNTIGQCNPISDVDFGVDLAPQSQIGPAAGDTDYYCFSLNCGDSASITITPITPLRPRIDLFHMTGQTLFTQSQGSVLPAVATLADAEAGTYSFQVRGNSSTLGLYTIKIVRTPGTCAPDPLEPTWGTDEALAACAVPPAVGARYITTPVTESRKISWAGTLSTARDVDTYCVDVACGQGLRVTVTPGNPTFVPTVKFIAPTLVSPTSNVYQTTSGPAGVPLVANVAAAFPAGTWRVEITSSGTTKGLYTVAFTNFTGYACADAYESDDTSANCTPIATDGTRQQHVLYPVTDRDWFCFDVTECGSKVVAQTVVTNPTLDVPEPNITIYDPAGNAVDFQLSGGHPNWHALISFTATMTGTYTGNVDSTNVAYNDTTGQYDVIVNVIPATLPLTVPVTETPATNSTILDALALAEVPNPAWLDAVVPGPGAVDVGTLAVPVFCELNSARYTSALALPFTFSFFGVTKSTVRVSENGYVSFSSTSGNGLNTSLPWVDGINDAIYAFWDGLTGRRGQWSYGSGNCLPPVLPPPNALPDARVTSETIGTAPSRQHVVTWSHLGRQRGPVPHPAGDYNFSITLEEATGNIVLRYGRMDGEGDSQGQSATVGLENATGTLAVPYSVLQPKIKPGLVLTFSPSGGSYTVAESFAPLDLVDYPAVRSCEYSIVADVAPFEDISATGTPVPLANWYTYGPFPGPNAYPPPACYYPYPAFFPPPPDPICGTPQQQPGECWAGQTLPFALPFHGQLETSMSIHANGFLSFGNNTFGPTGLTGGTTLAGVTSSNQCPLPTMMFPNGVIAPFWDDLTLAPRPVSSPGPTPGVYTLLDDPAGPDNARYIVQWKDMRIDIPVFGTPAPGLLDSVTLTFEAILHESGEIEFRYDNVGGATPFWLATGVGATIGLESTTPGFPYHGDPTSGTTFFCGTNNALGVQPIQGPVRRNLRVRFTRDIVAPSFEWRDADTNAVVGTGPQFTADQTTPCNLRLDVTARDPEQCCMVTSSQMLGDVVPPTIETINVGAGCLWPPNHTTVILSLGSGIDVVAMDACSTLVTRLVSCVSNEPDNGLGDGNTEGDCVLLSDSSVELRAERQGGGSGRVYTLGLEVEDASGNVSSSSFEIEVPHDQSSHDCPHRVR